MLRTQQEVETVLRTTTQTAPHGVTAGHGVPHCLAHCRTLPHTATLHRMAPHCVRLHLCRNAPICHAAHEDIRNAMKNRTELHSTNNKQRQTTNNQQPTTNNQQPITTTTTTTLRSHFGSRAISVRTGIATVSLRVQSFRLCLVMS